MAKYTLSDTALRKNSGLKIFRDIAADGIYTKAGAAFHLTWKRVY